MKILQLLFKVPFYESTRLNFSLLILRLMAGLGMAFGHGLGKIPPSEGFTKGVSEMGFIFPSFFAWSAGISEFFGGILLALGMMTRTSALFCSITMAVALFIRHADDPFARKEKALIYLVIFLFFYITGPGKYSVDERINKRFFI